MDTNYGNLIVDKLFYNIKRVIKGKDETVKKMLAAFLCGGHVLLEDVPGTGKTTLAKTLAKSIGTSFKRVQFTSDLLPSDLIGVSIYSQKDNIFKFNKGPIFTNILLADEINRANPRTQSALLEAMGEKQITVDGKKFDLNKLFFVIATENPIESQGTYPLPESQLDRFMIKLTPGYVDSKAEIAIISDQMQQHPLDNIKEVVSEEEIFKVMDILNSIRISEELKHYIIDIVSATRNSEFLLRGASTRASISLVKMSRTLAFFNKREFVIPEDIISIATDVIAHRVQLHSQAKFSGITNVSVIKKIIEGIKSPR